MRTSLLTLSLLLVFAGQASAVTLSTSSRWIVDEAGNRVKLACVNWPTTLEPVVTEGLGKQPVDVISKAIVSLGFNCVRFTYPISLVTNNTLSSLTVRQSLQAHNLLETIGGVKVNNPGFLDLTLIESFKAVVKNLGNNNLMVILDNHVSKEGWCCSDNDGNGFFGDKYFDPAVWLQGLHNMATLFAGVPNVVGMSLRNELRGPRQNPDDWYNYMQKGAEVVHAAYPDGLVLLGGISYDTDLSFLSKRDVDVSFAKKLVFELHWYSFSDAHAWVTENANKVCGRIIPDFIRRGGFLLDRGFPLALTEIGFDFSGRSLKDNRYYGCMAAVAADLDLDFAFWAVQGSYAVRQGAFGMNENYGILDWAWSKVRNETTFRRVRQLEQPFRGPGYTDTRPYSLLFHPSSGLCIVRRAETRPLELGTCNETDAWVYTQPKVLALRDEQPLCLRAEGSGQPVRVSIDCNDAMSRWQLASDSKLHLAVDAPSIGPLCLDVGKDGRSIVTNPCKCLTTAGSCDPESQWFKLVTSTRSVERKTLQV